MTTSVDWESCTGLSADLLSFLLYLVLSVSLYYRDGHLWRKMIVVNKASALFHINSLHSCELQGLVSNRHLNNRASERGGLQNVH